MGSTVAILSWLSDAAMVLWVVVGLGVGAVGRSMRVKSRQVGEGRAVTPASFLGGPPQVRWTGPPCQGQGEEEDVALAVVRVCLVWEGCSSDHSPIEGNNDSPGTLGSAGDKRTPPPGEKRGGKKQRVLVFPVSFHVFSHTSINPLFSLLLSYTPLHTHTHTLPLSPFTHRAHSPPCRNSSSSA